MYDLLQCLEQKFYFVSVTHDETIDVPVVMSDVAIKQYTVIPRLMSDPANEFFG